MMENQQQLVPPCSWDCHVHCFDPDRFPFRQDRAYTPSPASLQSLMFWSLFDNVVLVQATIESNQDGVLAHIAEGRQKMVNKNFYGTIVSTPESDQGILFAEPVKVDKLHAAGIRCIRVHAGIGAVGVDTNAVWNHLIQLASSPGVARYGWAIALQLPLRTWAALRDLLSELETLHALNIIADHVGCATPAEASSPNFEAFRDMLCRGRLYVKLSALHRRSPGDIHAMKGIVQSIASAAPDRLLWGSDWPHVDSRVKGLDPTLNLGIDALEELRLIKTWLSEDQWRKMMVENPRRVFRAG